MGGIVEASHPDAVLDASAMHTGRVEGLIDVGWSEPLKEAVVGVVIANKKDFADVLGHGGQAGQASRIACCGRLGRGRRMGTCAMEYWSGSVHTQYAKLVELLQSQGGHRHFHGAGGVEVFGAVGPPAVGVEVDAAVGPAVDLGVEHLDFEAVGVLRPGAEIGLVLADEFGEGVRLGGEYAVGEGE